MKIRPLDLRVLIKLDPTEKKTAGGIIIPDAISERNQMAEIRGEIIDMGANAFNELEHPPQVGQKVIIARYAGMKIDKKNDDDPEYRICNDEDVAAVIE